MTRYQDAWDANNRAGKTRIIGSGLNYQPIYLSPRDAQFIESQDFTKTEVATLFGIPAIYMLADGGNSMTYTNSVQVDIAFVRYTLTQYLNEIEQALSELIPRGQDARFVVEGLLRADQKTRFEGYALASFLTDNEKRAIEGYAAIEGGDVLAKPVATPTPNEGQKEVNQ
jgi:HK97 family phage portal protein